MESLGDRVGVLVRMDSGLRVEVMRRAEREGVSANAWVCDALERYIDMRTEGGYESPLVATVDW